MSEIVWEEPRERRLAGRDWTALLTPVMERPEQWARVAEFNNATRAYNSQSNLSRRAVRMPPGRWEFATRKVNGTNYLYARYLGPDEARA